MTDHDTPTPNTSKAGRPGGSRRLLLGVALAASFAVGGLTFSVLPALAEGPGMHMKMAGHHGGHGGGMMSKEHIEKVLTALDATPDQRAKIHAIMTPAFERMHALHGGMGATHGKLHALLLAPTVDRAALESLRAGKVAELDEASKVMIRALADTAEVLTPAQRAKLGQMMAEHGKKT